MIRSKSGAYAFGSPISIVLFPAVSGSGTVIVPVVLKLPVEGKDSVCGVPPFALTMAGRGSPEQYTMVTR